MTNPYPYEYSYPPNLRVIGHQAYAVTTGPTAEPLSIDAVKRHLKIDGDDQNTEIQTWIRAARTMVEAESNLALMTQTVDVSLDEFPYGIGSYIPLYVAPIQSVTYVKSYDSSGTLQTLTATNYVLDSASRPPRLGLAVAGAWPTSLRTFQPGVVRVVAGYTSAALIPEPILSAMKLLIGALSRDREPTPMERTTFDRLVETFAIRNF